MSERQVQDKQGPKRIRRQLVKTLLVIFGATLLLDGAGVVDIYGWPVSESGYVCAVCGRAKETSCPFGIKFHCTRKAPATVYCDQYLGTHGHIWLFDHQGGAFVRADGFAKQDIPLCRTGVAEALATLEGSPHIEPVVTALCDVDNYYALVARDVLTGRAPEPERLDEWWQENKRWFEIEHDAEKALKVLDEIYPNEDFYNLWDAAQETRSNLGRFGAPTRGAWRRAQENTTTLR